MRKYIDEKVDVAQLTMAALVDFQVGVSGQLTDNTQPLSHCTYPTSTRTQNFWVSDKLIEGRFILVFKILI